MSVADVCLLVILGVQANLQILQVILAHWVHRVKICRVTASKCRVQSLEHTQNYIILFLLHRVLLWILATHHLSMLCICGRIQAPYEGSGMNPARTFGSVVVSGYIKDNVRTHAVSMTAVNVGLNISRRHYNVSHSYSRRIFISGAVKCRIFVASRCGVYVSRPPCVCVNDVQNGHKL